MLELSCDESFFSKISVLHDIPPLLDDQNFDDLKNIKDYKVKLETMNNINYYIKSEDLKKIININDENIYLRLIIDNPFQYQKKENEDSMSVSNSPGRDKNISSKSSENIKERKNKRSNKIIDKKQNITIKRGEII